MMLVEEGSIWINLDDNEMHYLKVLCDEIFGRGTSWLTFFGKSELRPI